MLMLLARFRGTSLQHSLFYYPPSQLLHLSLIFFPLPFPFPFTALPLPPTLSFPNASEIHPLFKHYICPNPLPSYLTSLSLTLFSFVFRRYNNIFTRLSFHWELASIKKKINTLIWIRFVPLALCGKQLTSPKRIFIMVRFRVNGRKKGIYKAPIRKSWKESPEYLMCRYKKFSHSTINKVNKIEAKICTD